ncbi:MAG: hypothetical protein GXY83_04530 [Rhodopirellula sp.]|nr:hypothetical protein [Rhodopirellula sp.]
MIGFQDRDETDLDKGIGGSLEWGWLARDRASMHESEGLMISQAAVYDDLLDLLAESADADRVLGFRLSPEKQARLDDLYYGLSLVTHKKPR